MACGTDHCTNWISRVGSQVLNSSSGRGSGFPLLLTNIVLAYSDETIPWDNKNRWQRKLFLCSGSTCTESKFFSVFHSLVKQWQVCFCAGAWTRFIHLLLSVLVPFWDVLQHRLCRFEFSHPCDSSHCCAWNQERNSTSLSLCQSSISDLRQGARVSYEWAQQHALAQKIRKKKKTFFLTRHVWRRTNCAQLPCKQKFGTKREALVFPTHRQMRFVMRVASDKSITVFWLVSRTRERKWCEVTGFQRRCSGESWSCGSRVCTNTAEHALHCVGPYRSSGFRPVSGRQKALGRLRLFDGLKKGWWKTRESASRSFTFFMLWNTAEG